MAKSVRSKRKRLFRSIKRKRYAAKELIRLKNMLGVPVTETEAVVPPLHILEYGFKKRNGVKKVKEDSKVKNDQKNLNFTFTEKGTCIALEPSDDEAEEMNQESMGEHKSKEGETEINESQIEEATKEDETEMDHMHKKIYDKKTMKDQFGNYPPWFTQKDIKKQSKKNRLRKKIIKKKEMLKAVNEKKNKKLIKRKSKKPKAKETTEENIRENAEEKSKKTTEEKLNVVEQTNNDENQSEKMEH